MKKRFGAMIMAVVLLLTITACEQEEKESGRIYGGCSVHYIDVGQGDAALIQAGDTNSLIDTGTNSHYDELSAYLDSQNVEKLDNLIITHPDEHHSYRNRRTSWSICKPALCKNGGACIC